MALVNLVSKVSDSGSASVTSLTAELPTYATGARIYVVVQGWSGSTVISQTAGTTGWTNIITETNISVWEKDVSDAEANPSFDSTVSTTMTAVAIAVDDAGATDVSASISGSWTASGYEETFPAQVTTPSASCSSICVVTGADYRTNSFPTSYRSHAYVHSNFRRNLTVGSLYHPAAGLQPAVEILRGRSSNNTHRYAQIVFENAASGRVPGQADVASPPSRVLAVCGHDDIGVSDTLITPLDGNVTTSDDDVNNRGGLMMPYFSGTYFNFSMNAGDSASEVSNAVPTVATIDLSDALIAFTVVQDDFNIWGKFADGGAYVAILNGSKAGATAWKFMANDTRFNTTKDGKFPLIINTTKTDDQYTFGTDDLTDCTSFCLAATLDDYSSQTTDINLSVPHLLNTFVIHGGNAYRAQNMEDVWETVQTLALNTVQKQIGLSSTQYFVSQSIQFGNGTTVSATDLSLQNIEFPSAAVDALDKTFQINAGDLGFSFKEPATGSFIMGAGVLDCANYHTFGPAAGTHNSDIYDFTGRIVANANVDLGSFSNIDWSGIQFVGCKEIAHNGSSLGGVTISKVATGEAAGVTITGETQFGDVVTNATFKNNTNAPAIIITGNQSGTWTDPNLTVSGNTIDIKYTGATDFTIQSANALVVNNSSSGVLTIATPSLDFTVTSNIAGSDIKIFTTATQTILSQATGTTDAYTYTGTPTFDWTVMKKGYLPQRGVGEVMAGVSVTVNVTLIADSVYNASHGLTYTTNLAYARATSVLTLSTRQDARDIYSALVDGFIDESALDNTAFDFKAIGPDRIDLLAGVTLSNYDNWKGAGFIQYNSSDAIIAKYLSVKSSGTIPGSTRGEIQQTDGSGTVDLRADGAVDQIIQYYRDDNGDGDVLDASEYDYEDHLVIKFQPNGFQESRVNVLTAIGISVLEPFEYFIAMEPAALSAATGDPAISITVVDHTASPLVVGGKSFDYEIQDNGTNTAEDILKEWNYNKSLDATMHTLDPFNWPDFVVEEGATYATQVGFVEGQDTTTTLHGCYVERGSADHPDFTRFQSNDGTYYTPAVTANVTITGMPTDGGDIRLQLYNVTQATEVYNGDPASSGYSDSYVNGTDYDTSDVVRIRFAELNGTTSFKTWETTVIATASGWSALYGGAEDSTYGLNAIDGSAITKFTADFVNDEIDLSALADFTAAEAFAFYCHTLTTALGIEDFWGGVTGVDVATYKINASILSLKFDNTTTASKKQTDNARVYRDDDAYPVKEPTTSGYGIDINWKNPVYVQNVGGSSLSAGESATLTTISSKVAGLTYTNAGEVDVNTKSMNDAEIIGTGTDGDPWRGVGVSP